MWFKYASVFSIEEGEVTEEALASSLGGLAFKPCGPLQASSAGFVSPWGEESDYLIHANFGSFRLVYKREEKKIPKEVIASELKKRIKKKVESGEIEKADSQIKQQIKEEIRKELLPKVLPTQKDYQLYINTQSQMVVVDDSSAKRCEDVCSIIESAIDGLKISPLIPKASPSLEMSRWIVQGAIPAELKLGKKCNLVHSAMGTIKYDIESLEDSRLKDYLQVEGYEVDELGLMHNSGMSFSLSSSFILKACRPTEDAKSRIDSDLSEIDSDEKTIEDTVFSEMVQVHESTILYLIDALGGKGALMTENNTSPSKDNNSEE